MQILHVVRQYHPSVGGLETYVAELAARQAHQHQVTVLTLNRHFGRPKDLPSRENVRGIEVVRIPFLGVREIFFPVLNPLKIRGFDVVHVHATDQLLDVMGLISRFASWKLIVTTHGMFFHTRKFRRIKEMYLKFITRQSLKRAHVIFAVSENDARAVRSVGVSPTLLHNPIIPLGEYTASGSGLLYLGRIAPNKEIGRLLAFFVALHEREPSRRLHVVGSDPDVLWGRLSAPYAAHLRSGAIVYHGYLTKDDLGAVARECGTVVSASSYEGFGMSMVEGMSIGLLPLMHDNAAFREIGARSGLGLIVDFAQPGAAVDAFQNWERGVTAEARESAIKFARSQAWQTVATLIEEFYRASSEELCSIIRS